MTATNSIPQHIAIVMDGNGRWAKKRLLPTAAGHKAGVETIRRVLRACEARGVNCLTLFAFSSENWNRPVLEVKALMSLFLSALENEVAELHQREVRIRVIGRRDRFSPELLERMQQAELKTANNTKFNLNIAIDYGGQWDIANAAKTLAKQVEQGLLQADDINEEKMASVMSLSELPTPDLLIRTSGEYRISNFLLWQLAYAEFYFTDTLWPDFDEKHIKDAIRSYQQRDRRFGARTS